MSLEENKVVVRRFFDEVWNEGNREAIPELVDIDWLPSDSALSHIRPRNAIRGIETFVRVYRSAFPDLTFTVGEMVAEGEVVVTNFSVQGTNEGEEVTVSFLGNRNLTISPSGRTVKAHGVSINGISTTERDGAVIRRIKGNRWYWAEVGLLEGLAAVQLVER